jgi:alkanesulfonate monooxygenase SsuD/methylene tetrahydromethanopterin reductase-like flavin-dependent oxidoreductase (luciferase family)
MGAVSAPAVEFGIYLPQVGFAWSELCDRVAALEELGFHSVWFMDHLYPPEMPRVPSFEAWTTATAVLARTTRLRVGHLVLSNTFRHPVLLAKMATTLDVISEGRLELGIGSGSYAEEHRRAGIRWGTARERSRDLAEALAILVSMFERDETVFAGERHSVDGIPNRPGPFQRPRPPIHVGGAGERFTLPLAARFADVWNCPTYAVGAFDAKRAALARECERIGRDPASLRTSLEAVLVLARDRAALGPARELAERRFGGPGWGLREAGYVGTPDEIVARLRRDVARGIRSFVFFTHDRADPETLRLFAEEVRPAFAKA